MKSLLSKKFVLISLITVLLIGTGIATTLAYLRSTPDELTNTFTIGNVTTQIVEEMPTQDASNPRLIHKAPKVKNIGANDCYVRVRVVCTPAGAAKIDYNTDYWTAGEEDDFYYYRGKLDPNKETEPIFTTATVKDGVDSIEIAIYQEAVQTRVYAADGTFTEDPTKIWQSYADVETEQ